MRNKLIGLLVATVFLVMLILPGCGTTTPATNFVIPYLTVTSGPLAGPGYAPLTWAFQQTLDIINANGGVRGHNLTATVYDSGGGNPTSAYTQMQAILATNPLIVIDVTNPPCVDASAPLVVEGHYLAAQLVAANDSVVFLPWELKMTNYSENQGPPALGAWVTHEGSITTVCGIYGTSTGAIDDMTPKCNAALTAAGVNFTPDVTFDDLTTIVYGPIAAQAIATGADAFYINVSSPITSGGLVLALEAAGVNTQNIFLWCYDDGAYFDAVVGNASAADGIYLFQDVNIACNSAIMQTLVSRWPATFPGQPMDMGSIIRAADAALWVKYGLEMSGATNDPAARTAEREALQASLYNVSDFGAICGYVTVLDGVFMRDNWLIQIGSNFTQNILERLPVSFPPGETPVPLP